MSCPYTTEQAIDAVVGWSRKYGYSESFTQAALAVAIGESSLNPCAVGDNGQSFGIFQFYIGGGRGSELLAQGYSIEDLKNPYLLSEYNLPILHEVFQRYGGDSAWQSDPYTTLMYTWKKGQVSVWPSDYQLRDALSRLGQIDVANFPNTWPDPSQPDSRPMTPEETPAPTETPTTQPAEPTSPFPDWIVNPPTSQPFFSWLVDPYGYGYPSLPMLGAIYPSLERQPITLPPLGDEFDLFGGSGMGLDILRRPILLPPS